MTQSSMRIAIGSLLALVLLGQSGSAFAAINLDALQILRNISNQLDPWFQLVAGASYVMGVALCFKAVFALKIYGEQRTMMASNTSLKGPLTWLVVGAMFVLLPSTLEYTMATTFGEGRILMYSEWTGTGMGYVQRLGINSMFRIMQFIGFVSFIRGFMIITKAVQQGSQQHTVGKGFTHIVAGILGMNIVASLNMASATLGVQFS